MPEVNDSYYDPKFKRASGLDMTLSQISRYSVDTKQWNFVNSFLIPWESLDIGSSEVVDYYKVKEPIALLETYQTDPSQYKLIIQKDEILYRVSVADFRRFGTVPNYKTLVEIFSPEI